MTSSVAKRLEVPSMWVLFALALPAAAIAQTPPDPPPAPCATAAGACFAGCAAGQARSKGGQCVPIWRATGAASVPLTGASPSAAELAPNVEGHVASPPSRAGTELASPPCCYVPLSVTAEGIKNLGARAEVVPVATEVRINGQLVGRTPLHDELPEGDYSIEVAGPGIQRHRVALMLRAGTQATVAPRFELPLDERDLALRNAFRRERRAAAREARVRRETAAHEAEARRHAEWAERTRPVAEERSSRQRTGFLLGGAGLLVGAAGIGFELVAASADDDAGATYLEWQLEADEDARRAAASRVEDAEQRRDVWHALGIGALALGATGVVAGVAFLATMPALPEEGVDAARKRSHPQLGVSLFADGGALRLRGRY